MKIEAAVIKKKSKNSVVKNAGKRDHYPFIARARISLWRCFPAGSSYISLLILTRAFSSFEYHRRIKFSEEAFVHFICDMLC
jgi:hypothetical protein